MRTKSELRPYQQRIATALYQNNEHIVVARPGGGKTVAALTAIVELLRDNVIRHALVIAPKRVARTVWPAEIRAWEHTAKLRFAVVTGTPQARRAILIGYRDRDITIIGLDVVEWLLEELKCFATDERKIFDLLVLDEISRLRNPKGVRAKAIAKAADRWTMIWGMSGTLRPNGPEDLFMPARIVTRDRLWGKSFYKWQELHFYPTDRHGYNWALLPNHEPAINAGIATISTTLQDDELPQLPELSVMFDRFELPPAARKQYDSMHNKLFAETAGAPVVAMSTAVATGKLAQIANGFMYTHEGRPVRVHEEKAQWLSELIDEATGPTLLIYEYLEDLAMLRELLGDDLPYLGDGVSDRQSDDNIVRWNNGQLPFMALHPASGGHGLNLQHGGADMAWISPTWSPELWEQTIARLHRSGQSKPVIVRVCTAADTVDEMKIDRVHRKMSAQQAFEAYLRRHGVQCSV